ncbi:MAG TPA: PEP-utilizing enzyme [Gaiellaceae bacterium]|nr:PEP-utilizing enzyme [Gaiellaceae bacterium]
MAASNGASRSFPSPFDVVVPEACAGWEEMYPSYTRFHEARRPFEESRFWFQEALHSPEPFYPFDTLVWLAAVVALNQASARLFAQPSLGIEGRILNGYPYASPNSISDAEELARRAEEFGRRGGYYLEHWDDLYARWVDKVEAATEELKALEVPPLPELEDESVVTGGSGLGSGYRLLAAYDRLLEGLDRIFQYHFELLNLGYGAYLVFYELCRAAFPDIDDQTIAKMVTGIDMLVLRPDEELKRLAKLALEFDVAEHVKRAGAEEELRAALATSEAGIRWLADFEETKNPWFYFSCGTGVFYHHHRSWIDDPTLPIATIGSYVERLEAGEEIGRPSEAIVAERERVTGEYRGLLPEHMRQAFEESLALARTVFPYVEDHAFYIDHRYMTIFWNKVREFGALLAAHGFLADGEDVFLLRHDEVRAALEELRLWWSSGEAGAPLGPGCWLPLVDRRKTIYEAMRQWSPPPAFGPAPEAITEPMTMMLWGITTERVGEWLSSGGDGTLELRGVAASPGVTEGRARVLLRADDAEGLEIGEILVAPTTSTSWTPIFDKIAAAVLDAGGIMCHAAIVAREYGLPAVVGTGTGTKRIRTGDLLRVDADAGVVTILGRD